MVSLASQWQERPSLAEFSRVALAGRLTEISSPRSLGALTAAAHLILNAQTEAEPSAWLTNHTSSFFPPDFASCGIDLDALLVVKTANSQSTARAACKLLQSSAFGLVVLEVGKDSISMPLQSRLLGLARRHEAAVVCLTERASHHPSLSSLISLRGEPQRLEIGVNQFACELKILKDKRHAPTWIHREVCHGPPGLR